MTIESETSQDTELKMIIELLFENNNGKLLIFAIDDGRTNLARLLIKNGANVNAKNKDGDTALLWSVMRKEKEICELLLAAGADSNAKNNNGIQIKIF